MQMISLVIGGRGKNLSKTFSIFYMLNSKKTQTKTEFSTHIINRYLSNEKNTFADNWRVEPSIFLMEKYDFL